MQTKSTREYHFSPVSKDFRIHNIQFGQGCVKWLVLFGWWKYTVFLTSNLAVCIKSQKNTDTLYSNNSASRKF